MEIVACEVKMLGLQIRSFAIFLTQCVVEYEVHCVSLKSSTEDTLFIS